MINWINKKRKRKGFSLVELVVVVAILGIISAVAIPKLSETQERAKESAHKANVATLISAANLALAEHGIPDEDITWTAGETGDDVIGKGEYLRDNYISAWPEYPWDDGREYTVTIYGKSTAEGNAGDVVVTPSMDEDGEDEDGEIEE